MIEFINGPIAEKVPSLVLMVIMVFGFLKYIKSRDAQAESLHRESNTIIQENSRILGGVTEVLGKVNGHAKGR